jgi:hypothetical protein
MIIATDRVEHSRMGAISQPPARIISSTQFHSFD